MTDMMEKMMALSITGFATIGYLCYYFIGMHPYVCVVLFGVITAISVAIIGVSRWLPRKWVFFIGFVCTGFLAVLFFNPVTLFAFMYGAAVTSEEHTMCNPKTCAAVGETLALYCQSYPLLKSHSNIKSDEVYLWDGCLSEGLCGHVTVRRDGASVGMGGPLYDHGYMLSLDTQDSSPATNAWRLYFQSESKPDRLLSTFRMDATRQFTDGELLVTVATNNPALTVKRKK